MSNVATGSIRRDGDFAVIRIPMSEVHGLRVALNPCPCTGPKSTATTSIRDRIEKGLARLEAGH